jgi:uracil-DNA glycosylase
MTDDQGSLMDFPPATKSAAAVSPASGGTTKTRRAPAAEPPRRSAAALAADLDPFDPNTWDMPTVVPSRYAESAKTREERINAEIAALDSLADLHPAWLGITLGGPVEPFMPPQHAWNGVIVVGKAPGEAEVAHNEPFTGRSGRLTTKLLQHVGIDRDSCIITNVFRMQAAWSVDADGRKIPNDITHFFTEDRRLANERLLPYHGKLCLTGPDEHVRDVWRLIRTYRPKLVIGLGSIAAWALTGDGTMKGRLGEALENDISDAPVVLSYHPAYALHKKQESVAQEIAAHLAAGKAVLNGP